MDVVIMTGVLFVLIAGAAGYGMSRPGCPSWVVGTVTVLFGLGFAGGIGQLAERGMSTITYGDAEPLLLGGSVFVAGVLAIGVRAARRRKT